MIRAPVLGRGTGAPLYKKASPTRQARSWLRPPRLALAFGSERIKVRPEQQRSREAQRDAADSPDRSVARAGFARVPPPPFLSPRGGGGEKKAAAAAASFVGGKAEEAGGSNREQICSEVSRSGRTRRPRESGEWQRPSGEAHGRWVFGNFPRRDSGQR